MDTWSNKEPLSDGELPTFRQGSIINNRYRIEQLMGKGGVGSVYKAKDLEAGTIVAIKLVDGSLRLVEDTAIRLDREIRTSYAIQSDYVARLYSLFIEDNVIGLVLEYVDGSSLYDLLQSGRKLSIQEVTQIGRQIAMGLEAIHKIGIVHRDLKLENIILSKTGVAKITDFGVSLVKSASTNNEPILDLTLKDLLLTEKRPTRADQVVGTLHYLSPEYLTDQICDRRTDIYALGIVLYELTAGRFPYKFTTPINLVDQKVNTDPPPPSQYNPDCPPWLEDIILKAMNRDPNRRYQGAVMMIEELATRLRDPNSFPKKKKSWLKKILKIGDN